MLEDFKAQVTKNVAATPPGDPIAAGTAKTPRNVAYACTWGASPGFPIGTDGGERMEIGGKQDGRVLVGMGGCGCGGVEVFGGRACHLPGLSGEMPLGILGTSTNCGLERCAVQPCVEARRSTRILNCMSRQRWKVCCSSQDPTPRTLHGDATRAALYVALLRAGRTGDVPPKEGAAKPAVVICRIQIALTHYTVTALPWPSSSGVASPARQRHPLVL